MKLGEKRNHVIDTFFVICLMFLFVLCSISVIGIGASIYKKNVEQMSDNYAHRISCAYITEKVRQADADGAVYTETLFDKSALKLQENIGDVLYDTYIYEHDGYLMELFIRDDIKDFYPQSGQKILKIRGFEIREVSSTLLSASIVTEDGNINDLFIAKRSHKTE
jgi:hypothetical protein